MKVHGAVRQSRFRLIVTVLATAIALGVTLSAGFWQLGRAQTKQQLHDTRMTRRDLPALAAAQLPCEAPAWQTLLERKVRLKGRWVPGQQVWLDNRPMNGRAGFFLLGAFELDEATACGWRTLLVQRGWAPRDVTDRSRTPEVPVAQGRVTLVGRLAEHPSQVYALSQAQETGPLRQNVLPSALSREWGRSLSPGTIVQLQEDEPAPTGGSGLMRDWWVPQADVGKHQAYALQWFAMAAVIAGLFLWFQVWRRWRRAGA